MIEIGPSILSADFARLAEALALIDGAGARAVHVDVMDGVFVPNLTIGPPVVAALAKASATPLDCHLMIVDPDRYIGHFVDAGAARITVHAEACTHLHRTVHAIRDAGVGAGVALNPATPLSQLEEILPDLDQVLLMSVNPGFGGQSFIPGTKDKIERLAGQIAARGLSAEIQVDGGVGASNIAELVRCGARRFVAGNAVFGAPDPAEALAELTRLAEEALS